MNRVLLITNTLPDERGGRSEKIATRRRLLDELGWETVIGYVPNPRIRSILPDAVRLARLAKQRDIHVINSISNPHHLQTIGYLVSRFSRTPWLAEFRDPLVTNPDVKEGSLKQRARKVLERFIVAQADRVVWGDGIQVPEGYFAETYGPLAEQKVTRLPFAGVDERKFRDLSAVDYDEFTITYAGSFYDGWLEPFGFLDGVREYVTAYSSDVTVQFYGDWTAEYQEYVQSRGLESVVDVHDYVPHEEILPVLKGSDVVVYIGGSDPKNRRNVPSKIMDYVGVERPILAIAPSDFRVSKLVREHDLGAVASPHDATEIASAINDLRERRDRFNVNESTRECFSRRRKIAELRDILDLLAGPDTGVSSS